MVLFASSLDPQGGHFVLLKLNILHYNLVSPNPTSLSMVIPDAYQDTLCSASTPTLEPSPAGASTPTKTRNSKAAGLHNNSLDKNLLTSPRFNLCTCCYYCLQKNSGGGGQWRLTSSQYW